MLSADRFKATQSAACVLLFKELNRIAKVFGKVASSDLSLVSSLWEKERNNSALLWLTSLFETTHHLSVYSNWFRSLLSNTNSQEHISNRCVLLSAIVYEIYFMPTFGHMYAVEKENEMNITFTLNTRRFSYWSQQKPTAHRHTHEPNTHGSCLFLCDGYIQRDRIIESMYLFVYMQLYLMAMKE